MNQEQSISINQESNETKEKSRVMKQLKKKINKYEADPKNIDGRGVRHSVREQTKKTTRQLLSAFRDQTSHSHQTVRHEAGELIRSIPHRRTFKELADAASAYVGRRWKLSYGQNERQLQSNARTVAISDSLRLEEVYSKTRLQSVGRKLDLCVKEPSWVRHYIEKIRCGESELWTLNRNKKITGLMEIRLEADSNQKSVVQCNTTENEVMELPRNEAIAIVDKLNITACNCETFTEIGAFPLFVHIDMGDPSPEPIKLEQEWFRVWRTPGEMIIATTDDGSVLSTNFSPQNWRWSHFTLVEKEWNGPWDNHLSIERLFTLSLESRALQTALQDVCILEGTH